MNAHSKTRHVSPLRLTLAGAGVLGLMSAVGITYVVAHRAPASATTTTPPGSSAAPQTTGDHKHHSGDVASGTSSTSSTSTLPPVPLTLASVTPQSGSINIPQGRPITLTFSAPVSPSTPKPTISPAAAGTWKVAGDTMTFTPSAGWVPYSTVTVTVPAGITGDSKASAPTTAATTASFVVAPGSVLRLQQLLAILGYLPVTFAPTGTTPATALAAEPTNVADVATVPVAGAFAWSYPNTPAGLVTLWNANVSTVMTKGAIMAFESDHGLTTDGTPGLGVWNTLLLSAATHAVASHPYYYVMVSEVLPERLQVWSKGAIVASTLANTGAYGAQTELGTFPVFERFQVTTMRGTNPNGSKYVDPGIMWVAYFNGGDAVHQFYRPGYGYPQSNGCVELPSTSAEGVWGMDPLGTLVTVA